MIFNPQKFILDIPLPSKPLLVLLTLAPLFLWAQIDTVVVEEYSKSWLSVDDEGKAFQSFDGNDINAGGFYLSKQDLLGHSIRICGADFTLWLNGRMILENSGGCSFLSEGDIPFRDNQDQVFLSCSSTDLSRITADRISMQQSTERVYPLISNAGFRFQGWIWFFLLTMILLTLLKRSSSSVYKDLFRLRNLNFNQNLESGTPLGHMSIIYLVLLLSVIIGSNEAKLEGINQGVMLTLFFLGALFVKAFLIIIFSRLFNIPKVATVQFRSYLDVHALVLIGLFLLQAALIWTSSSDLWLRSLFQYTLLLATVTYSTWLFFFLYSKLPLRKLHLISYLCASEIFPTFILAERLF